jgi:hypothetical protein
MTLTVVLTIADLTSDTWVFPLRQIPAEERHNFDLPIGIATGHGDGVTDEGNPFGTTISIYVDDQPSPGVDLRVYCGWDVTQGEDDELRTQINVPFGEKCTRALSPEVTVTASFAATDPERTQATGSSNR